MSVHDIGSIGDLAGSFLGQAQATAATVWHAEPGYLCAYRLTMTVDRLDAESAI
jgi:hypothetical protein